MRLARRGRRVRSSVTCSHEASPSGALRAVVRVRRSGKQHAADRVRRGEVAGGRGAHPARLVIAALGGTSWSIAADGIKIGLAYKRRCRLKCQTIKMYVCMIVGIWRYNAILVM
jgi:hypothetical protein